MRWETSAFFLVLLGWEYVHLEQSVPISPGNMEEIHLELERIRPTLRGEQTEPCWYHITLSPAVHAVAAAPWASHYSADKSTSLLSFFNSFFLSSCLICLLSFFPLFFSSFPFHSFFFFVSLVAYLTWIAIWKSPDLYRNQNSSIKHLLSVCYLPGIALHSRAIRVDK